MRSKAVSVAALLLLVASVAVAQGKTKQKCKTEASASGKRVPPSDDSGMITLSRDSGCKDAVAGDGDKGVTATQQPKSTPNAFPFPEEQSRNGGEMQQRAPASSSSPDRGGGDLPAMPTDAVPDPPASSLGRGGLPGASSSGGAGVSSSRDGVDPDADVAPTTADPAGPIKAGVLADLGSSGESTNIRAKLDATRVADDLNVGRFYLKDGNVQGAYMRFTDAVTVAPEDADGHFGLAQAALKLGKRDEALLHFRETLRLDPEGDNDKPARKALAGMGIRTP